ncbi:unnamed protein product [marine sediment metagenome]|uniref:Uncharacterized protein n=1 Tax=marine sediment metagenome TaxID=412755 RepID=X1Q5Y1_9ZZZZ
MSPIYEDKDTTREKLYELCKKRIGARSAAAGWMYSWTLTGEKHFWPAGTGSGPTMRALREKLGNMS